MATSYDVTIKIPDTSTWSNSGYYQWNQITSSATAGTISLIDLLTTIVGNIDSAYSSSTTYTQQPIGSFIYITFRIRNMGINPAAGGDDLVALTLLDDAGSSFSGTFEAVDICNDCLGVTQKNCVKNFQLQGFEADTEYCLVFTDNQSEVAYTYCQETNEDGVIFVDPDVFPEGALNPYTTYTVTIYDSNLEIPQVISVDGVEYSCFQMTIVENTVL